MSEDIESKQLSVLDNVSVKLKKECNERFAGNVLESALAPEHLNVFPNPSSGYRNNPITELTPEIKSGYGWVGSESILEMWIVLLTSYCNMKPWRQIPLRGYYVTSKVQTRRFDLLLHPDTPIYQNIKYPIIITEFKSNYIDDTDVADTCLTKDYPKLAFTKFVKKLNKRHLSFSKSEMSYSPYTLVFQLVAPAGITEAGVKKLAEAQKLISEEFGTQIILDAVPLEFMVWHQIHPAIVQTYKDGQGKIGRQFSYVREDIDQLCHELCNPHLWVNEFKEIRKKFRSFENKRKYFL